MQMAFQTLLRMKSYLEQKQHSEKKTMSKKQSQQLKTGTIDLEGSQARS